MTNKRPTGVAAALALMRVLANTGPAWAQAKLDRNAYCGETQVHTAWSLASNADYELASVKE